MNGLAQITLAAVVMSLTLSACVSDSDGDPDATEGKQDAEGQQDAERCRRLDCSCYEPTFECTFEGEPSVAIMHGQQLAGLLPVVDGMDLPITLGPSGLYMLMLSVCARHLWPGRTDGSGDICQSPEIHFKTFLSASGELIGDSAQHRRGLSESVDYEECLETREIYVPFNHLDGDGEPVDIDDYHGQPARLRVTVKDACGRYVEQDVEVILVR